MKEEPEPYLPKYHKLGIVTNQNILASTLFHISFSIEAKLNKGQDTNTGEGRSLRSSPSGMCATFWLSIRAERLIAFAIISRYEKTRFFNRRGCDYTVTWHARVKRCVRLEDRSYDIKVRWEKAYRRHPLSYSSRSTLMTHTDRSSSAASSRTHLSSLQRKHQVGTLCCQVRSLPRVVFVSVGLTYHAELTRYM